MTIRLIQLIEDGQTAVAAVTDEGAFVVPGVASVYELAWDCILSGRALSEAIRQRGRGRRVEPEKALAAGRLSSPISHPDPSHMVVSVTGLTHLGSAESRDRMHRDLADPSKLTDTMRMFQLGLRGGKPKPGERGVQPEWLWKGNGHGIVAPGQPIPSPDFALDHGEEPEIVGIYLIGPRGLPHRVGFALGNEFSDHVTERENYLYLSHSKLRSCSIGPELLIGELPAHIQGTSRILRDGEVVWQKPFLSGEDNMCHSIANLEAHLFKNPLFRQPGDLHVYFLGTATLSYADGFRMHEGDIMELEAPPFTLPLRNPLTIQTVDWPVVEPL
jgi:hypothetical protein